MLPGDVEAPRMVLPMSKDWLQTYRGMFDFLPEETLRGMGVSDEAIKSKDWQQVGPEVVDKLSQYAQERRFSFQQQYEVPVSRLGAFENAGNIVGGKNAVEYLQRVARVSRASRPSTPATPCRSRPASAWSIRASRRCTRPKS